MAKNEECKSCINNDKATGACMKKSTMSSSDGNLCDGYIDKDLSAHVVKHQSRSCVAWVLFMLIALAVIAWAGWSYFKYREAKQKREDIVWKARCELELFRTDKTIRYLRLDSIRYSDGVVGLVYRSALSQEKFHKNMSTDSVAQLNFISTVMVSPERWKTISKYLSEAEVDIEVTMRGTIEEKSFKISSDSLSSLLSDEKVMSEALELFVKRKCLEVDNYARIHFARDKYIKPICVVMTKDFVELHLSYDDNFGLGYLNNQQKVPVTYRDAVGDMGSILDGMLTICSRTNRGFAFVYIGRKKHSRSRIQWDAAMAMEMSKKNNGIWFEGRKTNVITTGLYKSGD